jgi:cell division protease FtsH
MGASGISEEKEIAIDAAVKELCDEAYQTTMSKLNAHRDLLEELSNRLIEKETIDGFELNDIILKMTGKPPATPFKPVAVEAQGSVQPTASATAGSATVP